MINKEFIKETDQLIKQIKKRKIKLEHGNVLIARVKMDRVSAGGITLVDDYASREDYKSGFGRILALPEGFGTPGDAKLLIGQYVMFPHESPYKLYLSALREILQKEVTDQFIFALQDSQVIMTIPAEEVQK